MKKIFLALMLALFLFIPLVSTATKWEGEGFNVTITNGTEKKIYYWLSWVDHDLRHKYNHPVSKMGGELEPGNNATSGGTYTPGKYIFKWKYAIDDDDNENLGGGVGMQIDKDVKKVIINVKELNGEIIFE